MLQIGDKVETLDDNIFGVIKQIKADLVVVETDDGFDLEFNKKELVKIGRNTELSANAFNNASINDIVAQKEVKKRKSVKVKPKERYQPTMEVDLHIHQLTNSTKGMTKHDMLSLQLDTAKRQLNFAINKRIQRIVFIHGVGEGVLKLELEYLFKRYDNLKYYDANYQKYGLGATEVYIYQNV
jgi:preprotein translocase subunit YajC